MDLVNLEKDIYFDKACDGFYHLKPMQNHLPLKPISISKLFKNLGIMEDSLPISQFQRLADVALNQQDMVDIKLEFKKNQQNQKVITGRVQAIIELCCQRCLQSMFFEVDQSLNLILESEKHFENHSQQKMDSIQTESENLDIIGIIEDEILISIPFVPKHHENNCSESLEKYSKSKIAGIMSPSKSQFEQLKSLKAQIKREESNGSPKK